MCIELPSICFLLLLYLSVVSRGILQCLTNFSTSTQSPAAWGCVKSSLNCQCVQDCFTRQLKILQRIWAILFRSKMFVWEFLKKNNKRLCVHDQTRLFIFQVDYLDDINVETTYKLQNDVNVTSSMNSNQSAHGSGVSGARPKNSATKRSGGTFQNSSASFRPFQNHQSPLLGRYSQPNPSPPSYRDALERERVEHPTGNNAYPVRNNEHLWLQRKRVNDDSVEFTVWPKWSPARKAGQPTSRVFLKQYWILCLASVQMHILFSRNMNQHGSKLI